MEVVIGNISIGEQIRCFDHTHLQFKEDTIWSTLWTELKRTHKYQITPIDNDNKNNKH